MREVIMALLNSEPFNAARLVREIPAVPETAKVDDVLLELQRRRSEHAIVIDEYGGLAGILSADDVNRRVAGNLATTNVTADSEKATQPASVDGLTLVVDANRRFGLHVDESKFKTLGGFVLGRLGRAAKGPQKNKVYILAADASRRASLLVAYILPVCALLAPCRAGASTPIMHTFFFYGP